MDKLKVLFITDDADIKNVLEFCFQGWGYEVLFLSPADADIHKIIKLMPAVIVLDYCSAIKAELEICEVLKDDFATTYIPVITLINKRNLRPQLLKLREGVDDYLVKPPDPLDLKIRIEMAMKRLRHTIQASPLTGLPGSSVIEDVLNNSISERAPFVIGHIDIDNFKSFNDKYGYMKGDRVLMQTAYMLSLSVRNFGNRSDIISHIGGDDFAFVTSPDKYKEICQNFICMFDTIIPFHYSNEDRLAGYIRAKDRQNKTRRIPVMSVTIALVVRNNPDEVNNIIAINERLAQVKEYLKKIPGSKYMADRRIVDNEDHLTLQVFSNDESIINHYRPLGQILLDRELITYEQLDKALRTQWRSGEMLGEVLLGSGFITDQKLADALSFQEKGLAA